METLMLFAVAIPLSLVLTLLAKYGPLLLTTVILPAVRALIKSKVKNEKIKGILLRVDDALSVAVLVVFQTYVEALKDTNGNGKLDKAEKDEAARRAIAEAKLQMGDGWMEYVNILFGGDEHKAESAFIGRLEAQVARAKVTGRGLKGGKLKN